MINKYFIYFATMVLSAVLHQTWSQSQQHVWYFGNQKIDFTQSPLQIENIPSMGNITPQFVSDGAHDEYGRMVMNIVDDKVYNKFGGLIDYLESDLYSTPENVIIPYPASTCKYIILSTYNYSGASTITYSNVVDLAANNFLGSMSTSWSESSSGTLFRDIVVGKLNSNNERNFYLIDVINSQSAGSNVKLRKYKISNSGAISLESTNLISQLILSNTSPNPNFSWYLTDVELSNDGQKIHFVNGSNKIYTIDLSTNSFGYFSSAKNTLTSIELTPNGRIFFSHNQGIGYTNLVTEDDFGYNILTANSRLELTFENSKILAINNSGQCHIISDINNSLPVSPSLLFAGNQFSTVNVGIDGQTGLAHIPKQIDGEDYVEKYANGSSAGCCTFDEGIAATNITINGSTTWSQYNNYVVSGTIDIASGTLTIDDSEIHFGPNGKVIIRPGAKLILNQSTLTSTNCESLWRGIELQGNAGLSQDANIQGEITMDYSTISNAQQGISVYGLNGNQIDWSKTGGIIDAENSYFLNNWKDVAFLSYTFLNKSRFINTKFQTNASLFNNVHPVWHVTMYDVNGINFLGCEFSNSNQNLTSFHRGSGIKSIDSRYLVTGLCPGGVNANGGCPSLIRSKFNNLDFGIDATATNQNQTVEVSFSDFDKVIRGIALTGIDNSPIHNNNIHLTGTLPSTNLTDLVGIHVISCETHSIENNSIFSTNNNLKSYGIIVDNSNLNGTSDAFNQVYRNNLHNLTYGITANKTNAKIQDNSNLAHFGEVIPFTGLVFKCNHFFNSTISDITATGPVAVLQGTTAAQAHDPANNIFSEIPSQQADFWYSPLDQNLYYYYETSTNPSSRTEPYTTLYNPANTSLNVIGTTFNYTESCPNKIYPFVTADLVELKDDYVDKIGHYTDSIDGGDTDMLLQIIEQETPQVVYNLLNPLSGRLSDIVLRSLIDEIPRIPSGIVNSILIDNAPLTESVKLAVELSNLPVYYKTQLLSLNGVSPFDLLIQQLSFNKKGLELVGTELYRKIMNDTSVVNKLDTLVSLLDDKLNAEELLRFKIEYYILVNDYTSSANLLNQYISTFDNSIYEDFQSLLIEKINQPGKILGALSDSNTVVDLQTLISNAPSSREAQTAIKLFEFILNQDVYSDIDEINYIKSMKAVSESIQQLTEISLSVFPNPTTDFISFDLGLVDEDQASVVIYNLDGKKVFEGNFKANNSFLNTEDFKSGIYILNVTYSNGVKAMAQFTKI
jgi:hypothetical protein